MDQTQEMKALLQAMESPATKVGVKADNVNSTQAMKTLLESIEAPEVDEPKNAYANTPNEQTLDSKTQQDMGRDLNKKKAFQSPRKSGDNTKAGRMQLIDLEEKRLTDAYDKFKLNESALRKGMKWDTRRELADLLGDALREADLDGIIGHENFNEALRLMWEGDWNEATDYLMQYYATQNGGEPRNWQAIAEDLADNLEHICVELDEREPVALESTGEVNHTLSS